MKGVLQHSWKGIAIVLVLYAAITSFFLPMAPGIYHAENSASNPFQLSINTYNIGFQNTDSLVVWLQDANKNAVPASTISLEQPSELKAAFNPNAFVSAGNYSLWLYHPDCKTLFLPQAIYLSEDHLADSASTPVFNREQYIVGRSGFEIPYKSILYETIRNLNFHVTMWFVLLALMTLSVVYAVQTLRNKQYADLYSAVAVKVGFYFAVLGIITGSIWAKFTWGAWWVNDPKLNGAALTVLVYAAYMVLRQSIPDPDKRARLSAVYNVFAYVLMIVFIQILPRLTDSLHPGNGGNPAFSQYDLDNNLRAIFYPATLGWILVGVWIWNLKSRLGKIHLQIAEQDV